MRIVTRRAFVSLLLGSAVVLGVGCGGGSSTDTNTLPGTLTALALEGAIAPGTGGGTFGPIPPTAKISAADGGWTAFVAPVVGGTTAKALYVATPNGTVTRVFGVGDTVPAPGTGTINDFTRIFMRPNGTVAALVEITGASTRGVLTASVSAAGAVSAVARAFYVGETMPAGEVGTPGTLVSIDDDWLDVDDAGSVFFLGVGSNGAVQGLWFRSRNGANEDAIAVTGDAAPNGGGTLGFSFDGFGIDRTGSLVVFAATVTGVPGEMLLVRYGNGGIAEVARNTLVPPNASLRAFDDVFDGGGIVVSTGGGATTVAWTGSLTGSAPDRGLFFRQVAPVVGPNLSTVVACGEPWVAHDGSAPSGIVQGITLLMGEPDANRLSYLLDVAGNPASKVFMSWINGLDFDALFGNTATAPGGSTYTAVYPSLVAPEPYACDNEGSAAFTAVLADASSGVFWHIATATSVHPFAIVKATDTAPGTGGGAFASFGTQSTVVTATGLVVFRAALTGGTAPTGIFRQF